MYNTGQQPFLYTVKIFLNAGCSGIYQRHTQHVLNKKGAVDLFRMFPIKCAVHKTLLSSVMRSGSRSVIISDQNPQKLVDVHGLLVLENNGPCV